MTLLVFAWSAFLFSASDAETDDVHDVSPAFRQEVMLRQCLSVPLQIKMQTHSADIGNVCTWTGIRCAAGVAECLSIFMEHASRGEKATQIVHPQWLPHSLQFVHFRMVSLTSFWTPDTLPRELRYLYLNQCGKNIDSPYPPRIDLDRLPDKMEELIVIGTQLGRVIRIDRIPQKMHLLYLQTHSFFTDSICVDYHSISAGLEHLYVCDRYEYDLNASGKKVKKNGIPKSTALKTKYDDKMPEKVSRYISDFQKGRETI